MTKDKCDRCNYIELSIYVCMYVDREIIIVGTCMWRRVNRFRFLTSYQRVRMPIYYRQLVHDIRMMLYLCNLTDHKCINDQ